MKENPYEDVELHGRCLGKKCVLNFPSSPTSSIPDTPAKQSLSKPAFFRQNSERRNFKLLDTRKLSRDGTGSPSRVSPPSTPSSPDDTFFNLGDPQNGRKKRKIPKVRLTSSLLFGGAHPPPLQRRAAEESGQRADHWALFCLLCHRPGRHGGASRLG
uniref:Uncharacterized protein n=1 Tax=Sus scrofa TaxID=9823 RepID=A0A8D1DA81_PIG